MKLLLDTNIFIPLEPARLDDLEQSTKPALSLIRLCVQRGIAFFVHPDISEEVDGDRFEKRRALRQILLGRYPVLEDPPTTSQTIESALGQPPPGTHDWYDNRLIAALEAQAVGFLVTEDRGIHRKAERLGLDEKVLTIYDAVDLVNSLFDRVPHPPPLVQNIKAYQLDGNDPIFESLRKDYKGFDFWLNKCREEHRNAWLIRGAAGIDGIAIIKQDEPFSELNLTGKTLKLCTFKIAENASGFRLGELLLKTIFGFAKENHYDYIYLTVFDKHGQLLNLLEAFGFQAVPGRSEIGELIYIKYMTFAPEDIDQLDPLSFNIKFGPFAISPNNPVNYVIPIKPMYHELLFPEIELSRLRRLFTGSFPFGNSIRKAFLTKSNISLLKRGANILFYVSEYQFIKTLGILEVAHKFSDSDSIIRFVGNRTAYNIDQINDITSGKRRPWAILFRQTLILDNPVKLGDLIRGGVLNGPPQSVVTVDRRGGEWLKQNILSE